MEFTPFPKIPRLSRDIVITEKIDGTNASVSITLQGIGWEGDPSIVAYRFTDNGTLTMRAGSRTRWITPQDDNYGFARWVAEHAYELFALGDGHHYGEWWGSGIQRGYGLQKGEKRFSLFNTGRWAIPAERPSCCHVVPVLYAGPFSEEAVHWSLQDLAMEGSKAAPGFMDPEGIIVWHEAARQMFKKTLKKDELPKALAA